MEEKLMVETDAVLDKASYRWVMTHFNEKNLILGRTLFGLMPVYGLGILLTCGEDLRWLAIVLIAMSIILNYRHYIAGPKRFDAMVETLEKNHENENHYRFYETYVERTNATGNLIVKYENFSALRENDALFVFWAEPGRIVLLNKKAVEEKDYDFLRGLVPEENAKGYEKKAQKKRIVEYLLLTVLVFGMMGMVYLGYRKFF